jgi:hypothetical protein
MAITKLKETNGDQVRKLLEANGVTGVKAVGKRFDIRCPACEKPEAFIDYQGDHRWIKCNRGNNCGYNTGLWEFIAQKQSIDPGDNKKMLEYINYTIGQEFTIWTSVKNERFCRHLKLYWEVFNLFFIFRLAVA